MLSDLQQHLEDFKTDISQLRKLNELTEGEKESLTATYRKALGDVPDIAEWFAVPDGGGSDPDFQDYDKKKNELISTIKQNRAKIEELSDVRKQLLTIIESRTRSNVLLRKLLLLLFRLIYLQHF
jgi:hypothetical protein